MNKFNNHEYESLASDLIGDIFYANASFRTKISTVRKYAEVIVRKILDIEPEKFVSLGWDSIQKKIRDLPDHEFIEPAVNAILDQGNPATHTQHLGKFTAEDFDKMIDSMFDMLSYLLIRYFEKYEFGTRPDVLRSFSLLPPIIRYKVLDFLHQKYPENISVIDKLVLAIMKAFRVEDASEWVEREKDALTELETVSERGFYEAAQRFGVDVALAIKSAAPANMYELCKEKIALVGESINRDGPLYSDFESALPYYQAHGKLEGDDPEAEEFNDIMDFLYLGRKEK